VKPALRRPLCLLLALGMALPFPGALALAAAEAPAAAAQNYPPFLIGPGDILNITVYGEKDLPITYLVDSNGSIVFPLVGDVQLAGLTQSKAGQELASRLAGMQKDPQVTVLITETAQYTISVLGNVVNPGKYRIRGLPNLLSAISEAGGPRTHSALNSTVLVRGESHSKLPLGDFLSSSDPGRPQPLLYPGDTLFVPLSPWPTLGEWSIIVGLITSAVVISASLNKR
jgi:polysaccharide export outer membrane protein